MVTVEAIRRGLPGKGGSHAHLYVVLLNCTDQGASNFGDTVERAGSAAEAAERHGARLERLYWSIGPYDLVSFLEAPDEETVTAFLLETGSAVNVRTTTLRAFDRGEGGIIGRLR